MKNTMKKKKCRKKKTEPPMVRWHPRYEELPGNGADLRDEIDKKLILEGWDKILNTLYEREKIVIVENFFKDRTLIDIAKDIFTSNTQAGIIRQRALRKLRHPQKIKMMATFNIPIAEDWLSTSQLKNVKSKDYYIPIKPEWVKVEYSKGVPRLFAPRNKVLHIRPITHRVYKVWLNQALKEDETNSQRKATA